MKQHIYSLSAFITMTVFVSTQFYWPIEGDCEIMMHWFNVCVFCFTGFEDDLSGRLGTMSQSVFNWKAARCRIKPLVCLCHLTT